MKTLKVISAGILFFLGLADKAWAQDAVKIFTNTRIVNAHTTDLPRQGELDFRIKHRFGDFAGAAGGVHTLFGLDQIADYRIAFEYGVTDNLLLGFGRSLGGVYTITKTKAFYDGLVKWKLMTQKTEGSPIDLALYANMAVASMKPEGGGLEIANVEKAAHRFSYTFQLIAARRFNDRLAFQVMPTVVHRNLVPTKDENVLPALGVGGKIGITKITSFVFDYYLVASAYRRSAEAAFAYSAPLGVGLEFDTGKHLFNLNFTNSTSILENLYLPYTTSNWRNGSYRLGFTIARRFTIF